MPGFDIGTFRASNRPNDGSLAAWQGQYASAPPWRHRPKGSIWLSTLITPSTPDIIAGVDQLY